jgi:hypothetical protein
MVAFTTYRPRRHYSQRQRFFCCCYWCYGQLIQKKNGGGGTTKNDECGLDAQPPGKWKETLLDDPIGWLSRGQDQ